MCACLCPPVPFRGDPVLSDQHLQEGLTSPSTLSPLPMYGHILRLRAKASTCFLGGHSSVCHTSPTPRPRDGQAQTSQRCVPLVSGPATLRGWGPRCRFNPQDKVGTVTGKNAAVPCCPPLQPPELGWSLRVPSASWGSCSGDGLRVWLPGTGQLPPQMPPTQFLVLGTYCVS